ncbi:MAG TPA: hypothetical protein VGG86_12475 [Roseiarcus sp.]
MTPLTPQSESCGREAALFASQFIPVARTKPDDPALSFRTERGSASAGDHLVHLHDRFDLRVVGDVAHDLRTMLGERILEFAGRVEVEVRDREIGRRLAAGGIGRAVLRRIKHRQSMHGFLPA